MGGLRRFWMVNPSHYNNITKASITINRIDINTIKTKNIYVSYEKILHLSNRKKI